MNTDTLQGFLLSTPALAIFGLCIGSFLNVVIHRLPLMLEQSWRQEAAEILELPEQPQPAEPINLSQPPSRCPKCGHQIRWFENIPIISWLVLRARCSACKTPISPRYPLIELACGLLFAGVGTMHGGELQALLWCGFVASLLVMAAIDWDTTLLPDNLTLPLMWAGLVAAAAGWTLPLSQSLWGAVAGYMSLWTVDKVFKLVTRRTEGMGNGDFKLLAALGAWLGLQMLLPVVLASSLIGSVIGIAMKLSGSLREGRFIPFGPFLAGAGLVVMFAGPHRVMVWLGWA